MNPAVTVAILRPDGAIDVNSSATVSLRVQSPTVVDTIVGISSVAAVRGVALFPGVVLSRATQNARLYARSPDLVGAESPPFSVVTGAPAQLVFLTEPAGAVAGQPLPELRVQVRDVGGNPVTTAAGVVSIAVATGPAGGVATGTLTANLVDGEVRFSNVRLPRAGAGYTLTAALVGNPTVRAPITSAFTTAAGAPAELAFQTDLATVQAGAPILPAVRVAVLDGFGNTVTDAAVSITLDLAVAATGAQLLGTTNVVSTSGIATFSGIRVDRASVTTRLRASGAGLTPGLSTVFAAVAP